MLLEVPLFGMPFRDSDCRTIDTDVKILYLYFSHSKDDELQSNFAICSYSLKQISSMHIKSHFSVNVDNKNS